MKPTKFKVMLVERGIKQSDIARSTGLSLGYFNRLVNGHCKSISHTTASLIADALSMELDEVIKLLDVEISNVYWACNEGKRIPKNVTFLRGLMIADEITVEEIAEKSGFSSGYIKRISYGYGKTRLSTLIAIARAIDYFPEYAAHLTDKFEYSYIEETLNNGLFPWERDGGAK